MDILSLALVKTGHCPVINASQAGDCSSECSHDAECNGDMKCCASGCSRKCLRPGKEGLEKYRMS